MPGTDDGASSDRRRFWAVLALACLAFAAVWALTLPATPTHDEVVYLDVAETPLTSQFYPGDTFLRHPPLGLALLAAWTTVGLAARAWPLVWTLAGLGVLGDAIRRRDRSPILLFPVVLAAPIAVPLATVTLYPTLFFFLAVTVWGRGAGRRDVELVGWNLAVLTHELALLLLAVLLATKAIELARERVGDVRSWARLVWPYPAAVAWGLVMLAHLLAGDGRGDYLATITDPSPNVAAIIGLEAWVGLVVLLTVLFLLPDPRTGGTTERGLAAATLVAVVVAPFYRYVLALVPHLTTIRGRRLVPLDGRQRSAALVLGALAVSGLSLGASVWGLDTLNAGNLPGLVDHDEAVELVGPGEAVVVRSSPSFAHALTERGWTIAGTAPTGPARVELTRGDDRVVLYRAETLERLREVEGVDALVLPAMWVRVPDEVPGGTWQRAGEAGGAIRWEPR